MGISLENLKEVVKDLELANSYIGKYIVRDDVYMAVEKVYCPNNVMCYSIELQGRTVCIEDNCCINLCDNDSIEFDVDEIKLITLEEFNQKVDEFSNSVKGFMKGGE
ncbi:MAG: hypothetical protein ACRDD7_11845 [Peptostreptococcaceae bacterium]